MPSRVIQVSGSQDLNRFNGAFRRSPVLADGKLYLTATDGTVSVLRPGRTFEVMAKNSVDGGRLAATPAISEGTIYLRTYETLFANAEEKPQVAAK